MANLPRCCYQLSDHQRQHVQAHHLPPPPLRKESGVITQVEKVPLSSTTFPRRSKQYMTAKREAIITAACAFGNSFTLPLVPLLPSHLLFTPFTPCFFYTFLNFIVLFHHQYPVAYFDGGMHSSDIFWFILCEADFYDRSLGSWRD